MPSVLSVTTASTTAVLRTTPPGLGHVMSLASAAASTNGLPAGSGGCAATPSSGEPSGSSAASFCAAVVCFSAARRCDRSSSPEGSRGAALRRTGGGATTWRGCQRACDSRARGRRTGVAKGETASLPFDSLAAPSETERPRAADRSLLQTPAPASGGLLLSSIGGRQQRRRA